MISSLTRPGRGAIRWRDTDITSLSESRRDHWRAENIGLVMQPFYDVVAFVQCDRKSIFRRKMIIDADHRAIGRVGNLATPGIIVVGTALNESTAVNIHEYRQRSRYY